MPFPIVHRLRHACIIQVVDTEEIIIYVDNTGELCVIACLCAYGDIGVTSMHLLCKPGMDGLSTGRMNYDNAVSAASVPHFFKKHRCPEKKRP